MTYDKRLKDARSKLDDVIGKHGITVTLDVLVEFAADMKARELRPADKRRWASVMKTINKLTDRTLGLEGVSLEGR